MPKKKGRKSKKHIVMDNIEQIKIWRRQGQSLKNICNALGVTYQSVYKYAENEPALQIAIDTDKEIQQLELEKSLMYHATKTFTTKYNWIPYQPKYGEIDDYPDEDKKKVGPNWFIRIPVEDIPFTPNSGLLTFALKNYDNTRWKDTTQTELTIEKDETVESIHNLIDTLKDE